MLTLNRNVVRVASSCLRPRGRWLSNVSKRGSSEVNTTDGEEEFHDWISITAMPVNPLQMNQIVFACSETKQAAIVDTGVSDAQSWKVFTDWLKAGEFELKAFIQTHAHVDHVAGLGRARVDFPDVPIYMHQADRVNYDNAEETAKMYGFQFTHPLPTDNIIDVNDGDKIKIGNLTLEALYTPGHAPGHLVYLLERCRLAFVGDLVFEGSIGRTDLPHSSPEQMEQSLQRFVARADHRSTLISGHGRPTLLSTELDTNPFLVGYKHLSSRDKHLT